MEGLENQNMLTLRAKARELKIKNINSFKKPKLIEKIIEAQNQRTHENLNQTMNGVFSFDKDLFIGPRKARVKKVKCECGDYINPSYMRQHINNSKKHRKEIDAQQSSWLKIESAYESRFSTWRKLLNEASDIENTMNDNLEWNSRYQK